MAYRRSLSPTPALLIVKILYSTIRFALNLFPYFMPGCTLWLAISLSNTYESISAELLPKEYTIAQLSSSSVQVLLDQAAQRANAQDYTSAVSLLTQALNLSPPRELTNQILLNRSKIYLVISQPRLSLDDLKLIEYAPSQALESANLWLLRGSAYLLLKDYSSALSALSEAHRTQPNNPMILSNRAVAYRGTGQLELAKQDIEAAIRIQPNQVNYYNLSVVLYQLKDYKSCISILADLIKKSTPFPALYYQRGLCSLSLGVFDSAIADMLKVLTIDPEHADALEQLGVIMLRQNKMQAATQYLSKSSSVRLSRGDIVGYNRVLLLMKQTAGRN